MTVLGPIFAAVLTAGQHPAVITNPDWVKKPSGEEFEAYYPKLMLEIQLEGEADIKCDVAVEGDPANCVALFETPRGLGVGAAAVATAAKMKFVPMKINGVPAPGGTFRTTIRFRLDAPSPGPIASAMPPAGSDAEARAMALRLAVLLDSPLLDKIAPERMAQAEAQARNEGDAVSRKRVVAAYLAALKDIEPQINRLHANLCLRALSADQIGTIVAFLETPSGQTMIAKGNGQGFQYTPQVEAEITAFMESDAGRAFVAYVSQVFPKVVIELDSQGPALAAATLKTYCAQPEACPKRVAISRLPSH